METNRKITTRFRELLRQELQIWQTDGLVSAEQSAVISQKYRLDQIQKESTHLLILAIYIIGAALIGGGVISFVAAHWEIIPAGAKVAMIIACMLAAHIIGYYLWKISGLSPRLGHALVVLGTLVFGANIGLMAQIFHIRSDFYNGFFAWAIGAILMAYAIESVPNAVIALIVSFIGFCGWVKVNPQSFCYYPFVAAAIFLPFAYLRRSVSIYTLSLAAVGCSVLTGVAAVCEFWRFTEFSAIYLTGAGLGLLFFGYGLVSNHNSSFRSFAFPAMVLGVIITALTVYILSFREVAGHIQWLPQDYWQYSHDAHSKVQRFAILSNWWKWAAPAISIYFAAVIMWLWSIIKGGLADRRFRPLSVSILVASVMAIAGIIIAALLPHSLNRYDNYIIDDFLWIVIFFNLGCFALCAGMIAGSFQTESRGLFWAGILFTALVIASRFLEYETGLIIKAVIFIACGIAIILAGVGFENYLRKRRIANE